MTFYDFCDFVDMETEIEVVVYGENQLPYIIKPTQYNTNDPLCLVQYFEAKGPNRVRVILNKDISKEVSYDA